MSICVFVLLYFFIDLPYWIPATSLSQSPLYLFQIDRLTKNSKDIMAVKFTFVCTALTLSIFQLGHWQDPSSNRCCFCCYIFQSIIIHYDYTIDTLCQKFLWSPLLLLLHAYSLALYPMNILNGIIITLFHISFRCLLRKILEIFLYFDLIWWAKVGKKEKQ